MDSQFSRLRVGQIRQQIHSQGLKHWWVAEVAGIHQSTLRRWLTGKIGRVRRSHVDRLAQVLTVPSNDIAEPIIKPARGSVLARHQFIRAANPR